MSHHFLCSSLRSLQLAEMLEMEKWLRNEHGRMWTVRVVSATDMDGVADSLLWAIEERWRK